MRVTPPTSSPNVRSTISSTCARTSPNATASPWSIASKTLRVLGARPGARGISACWMPPSGEFDVIVAEDVSRLWRLMAEQAPRLAELRDLGVQVVTRHFDTREESADTLGAVNGAMSEHYRKE